MWIDLSNSIAYFTYFLSSEWKPPSSSLCVSPSCSPDRRRKPRLRRTKEWLLKKGFQVIKQIIYVYHFLAFKHDQKQRVCSDRNWNGIITASCICFKIRITVYKSYSLANIFYKVLQSVNRFKCRVPFELTVKPLYITFKNSFSPLIKAT